MKHPNFLHFFTLLLIASAIGSLTIALWLIAAAVPAPAGPPRTVRPAPAWRDSLAHSAALSRFPRGHPRNLLSGIDPLDSRSSLPSTVPLKRGIEGGNDSITLLNTFVLPPHATRGFSVSLLRQQMDRAGLEAELAPADGWQEPIPLDEALRSGKLVPIQKDDYSEDYLRVTHPAGILVPWGRLMTQSFMVGLHAIPGTSLKQVPSGGLSFRDDGVYGYAYVDVWHRTSLSSVGEMLRDPSGMQVTVVFRSKDITEVDRRDDLPDSGGYAKHGIYFSRKKEGLIIAPTNRGTLYLEPMAKKPVEEVLRHFSEPRDLEIQKTRVLGLILRDYAEDQEGLKQVLDRFFGFLSDLSATRTSSWSRLAILHGLPKLLAQDPSRLPEAIQLLHRLANDSILRLEVRLTSRLIVDQLEARLSYQPPDRAGLEGWLALIPRQTSREEIDSQLRELNLQKISPRSLHLPGGEQFLFEIAEADLETARAGQPAQMLITHMASGNRWFGRIQLVGMGFFESPSSNGFGLSAKAFWEGREIPFWIDLDGGKLDLYAKKVSLGIDEEPRSLGVPRPDDSIVSLEQPAGLEQDEGRAPYDFFADWAFELKAEEELAHSP